MADNQKIFLEQVKNFIDQTAARKDWLYIFSPCSIGDFFYNGGLSHAVQARKNKSATVLVVKERMKNLHVTYKNFAQILYLNNETMNAVQNYFYLSGNYEADNYIYGHFARAASGGYIWDENIHLIDRYKKNVFSIPLDTPFVPPIVEKISPEDEQELEMRYTLDKDRTIIISPYVHSSKQLAMSFWENLAVHLKQCGYIVYTNTDGFSEKPVVGTEPITTTLPQLYFVSSKIKCFVGSRNGIFDFLGMTKTKLLNIVPLTYWDCDISIIFPQSNNRTLYNAMDYVQPVMEYFKKSSVNATISLTHEKIRSSDIVYDYDTMLREILNSIE
ncbi:MAG: hypothetical protein J5809_08500 [Selenomonadaceae bacterium]|nr:hypothetical protein [Selenomonadaceae bacterium]